MKKLALIPHNDDEALFLAYTLMREKPFVCIVTDAHIQKNRGEVGCDPDTRWNESKQAMNLLDCQVMRLGIPDFALNKAELANCLNVVFGEFDVVYAPALQGGNPHHDIISEVAKEIWGNRVVYYSTYARGEWFTKGNKEIIPTEEEFELKKKALNYYQSQINLASTRGHFNAAIEAKSEWQL